MCRCPRCFVPLPPDVFTWTESDPVSTSRDDIASAYTGTTVMNGPVHTERRPANAGPGWAPQISPDLSVVELCPTCHYALPPHWRWGETTCVAMAGARYTGKTVYIAVLIKQLQKYAERFDREVIPADAQTARDYQAIYEQPLYVERGIVQATPKAATTVQNPLIFNLGIWEDRHQYLVIRDVAGEDLEDHETAGRQWDFFSYADAVLFLFDPLRVEEISDQLRDLIPPSARVGGDPSAVLRVVMRLIGNGTPKLGVILSKFDALQALSRVKDSAWGRIMSHPGAAFNRDPSLVDHRYNEDDGQLLDAEVRSLLQRLHAGPNLRNVRNPSTGFQYDQRFFAVSALGESPEGEKLHRNGISPFRCLDPIRWVLAEKNVLHN